MIGENPAQSEADQQRAERLLEGLDHLVVQDIFLTRTAELADVVLPAARDAGRGRRGRSPRASAACSACARRSTRRARRATTSRSSTSSRAASATTSAAPRAEDVWDEVRSLSPMHAGMSYARLEELGGIQWPCWDDERSRRRSSSTAGCGTTSSRSRAPFMPVEHDPPVDLLDDDFPLRLTTGRRLESFNTGVQTGGFDSPLHVGGEAILARAGGRRALRRRRRRARARRLAARLGRGAGRATTRRCGPGLAFMNLHFPDVVATNVLTIDATDPKSGTAEFKATAIRVEAG